VLKVALYPCAPVMLTCTAAPGVPAKSAQRALPLESTPLVATMTALVSAAIRRLGAGTVSSAAVV
jgi:hypothetical protein